RNNRFEILSRLGQAGAALLTGTAIAGAVDGEPLLQRADERIRLDPIDAIVMAIGAEPNRDVVPAVEAAGVPYVLVGDCRVPGDFLTAIRDASMAALALGHVVPAHPPGGAGRPALMAS